MIKYFRLPVVDDGSVDIMLEIPSIHPSISNVELYLEVESILAEPAAQQNQSIGSVPIAHVPTQDNDTLLDHANVNLVNHLFSLSSSEATMERQASVIGNIFGFSDCRTISQYDRDTSVKLVVAENLVNSEPNDIFRDTNVNNRLVEEENEEPEEEEDFKEDGTNLDVPHHDPKTTFFIDID
ncbi:hypothetical protein PTKIN_Ptkin17bG0049300 [Pterospermum kingtungense]